MKHNVCFEGNVQSLSVNTEDGYATVGVITPGQYTFFAESEEHVTIVSGRLHVKLPNQDWSIVRSGEKYVVPYNSSFDVKAENDLAYICYYKSAQPIG
jgi:purine/pyrimidine-nucleoside phosphorylase